jgi:hypothetical protein
MKIKSKRSEIITKMPSIIFLKRKICLRVSLETYKINSVEIYKLCKKDWSIRNVNLQNLKRIMLIFKIPLIDRMIFREKNSQKKEKN